MAHYEAEYYRLDVTAAYIDVSGLKMANDTLESMLSKIIECLKTAGREGYRPSEFTDLFYPQQ